MMDHLDNQLRRALRPADPPPDFAAKVMARVAKPVDVRVQRGEVAPIGWWAWLWQGQQAGHRAALAAGMACLLLMGGAGLAYRQHQVEQQIEQQRRAEAARDQLFQALQITSVQLNHVGEVLAGRGQQ